MTTLDRSKVVEEGEKLDSKKSVGSLGGNSEDIMGYGRGGSLCTVETMLLVEG